MIPSPRVCWLAFAVICAGVLVPLFLLGLRDRTALEPVLVNGGIVESSPALILLLASLSSALIVMTAKKLLPWGLLCVFCLFLTGEEANWGRDRILGWEPWRFADEESQPADLHNWFSNTVAELMPRHSGENAPPMVSTILGGVVMILAVGVLGSAIGLGLFAPPKRIPGRSMKALWQKDLSLQFVINGIVLILFGFVDMLEESFGLSYVPGLWPLEESFEVLGSIALLFAGSIKLFESVLAKRAHRSES